MLNRLEGWKSEWELGMNTGMRLFGKALCHSYLPKWAVVEC